MILKGSTYNNYHSELSVDSEGNLNGNTILFSESFFFLKSSSFLTRHPRADGRITVTKPEIVQ